MTVDGWERVRLVFFAAMDRSPGERSSFLDEACRDDPELRQEVDSLLASHAQAGSFLEVPARVAATSAAALPALTAGTRLGPYEIVAAIGSGGMGEVYHARDTRLLRDVAVKVLPRELALDPGRRQRFEQEARAASALNHPNILAVYDTGWHGGAPFMVSELLQGQTLAERLAQGALPVRKALECAVQSARGLAAAHEKGIVHRDVKPANLFITSQGQIKVLDFGIARLAPVGEAGGGPEGRTRATLPGQVFGTVGYMSPEQVRGDAVDARSDQFSLGCVLYEMLAGRAPFQRPSAAQTMAAVLEAEPPPLPGVNVRVPQPVAWIVERCLAKDPQDRYGATVDLARDLELALGRLSDLSLTTAATPGRRRVGPVSLVLAATALAAFGVAVGRWALQEPPSVPVVRYLTYSGRDSSPAAAPDGKTVAFSSSRDGVRRIWLKQLATGSEVPLTAGEDEYPRFSPDGSVVLFARSEGSRVSLYRVPSVGGEPRKLVEDALYGDFAPDGRHIAFVRQLANASGISSLIATAGADGSDVRDLAHLGAGAFVHPRWSPDGRTVAITESPLQLGEPTVVALVDVGDGRVRRLQPEGDAGVWPGGLAWAGPQAVVCSQPESAVGQQTATSSRVALLDIRSRRARPLLSSPVNILTLDVLAPGRLVLEARSLRQNLRELALRPSGEPRERWLTRGNSADRQPVYARDGEWIAFSSNRSGNLDVWAVSRRTGAVRRLTDDPAQDADPAFTPDGRLLWSSNRTGHFEVWIAEGDGSGARQVTHDGVDAENPAATPDGRWIVYASANPRSRGIARVRPDGSEAGVLVPGYGMLPEVSPDGRHLAFVADQGSEHPTLRVARLPDGAPAPFEVALRPWTAGATVDQGRCRWLPDGGSLVYVAQEADGSYAVYLQQFAPGADTRGGRRRIAGLEPGIDAESLAISPDGASLTVSFREQLYDLMLAEGVPGLERARGP